MPNIKKNESYLDIYPEELNKIGLVDMMVIMRNKIPLY